MFTKQLLQDFLFNKWTILSVVVRRYELRAGNRIWMGSAHRLVEKAISYNNEI